MLNIILENQYPVNLSDVSGIPNNWNRSLYNKKQFAYSTLSELVEKIKAKYILISYNSDGFISLDEMNTMLKKIGKVKMLETSYNTFRGCRNLSNLAEKGNRHIHVTEYLYLLKK